MPGYELKVWAGPNRTNTPDRVEEFEAVDDAAAKDHMDMFATTLHRSEDVYLYSEGVERSIASTSGSLL